MSLAIGIQKLTLLKNTKRQRPQNYGFMRLRLALCNLKIFGLFSSGDIEKHMEMGLNQNLCCDASLTDCTMTAFVEFCPKIIRNES